MGRTVPRKRPTYCLVYSGPAVDRGRGAGKTVKKLVAIIVVLGLAICGTFGLALYNANALIERYRPEMERVASEALGSEVTFGSIAVSLFPDARVLVNAISISRPDAPQETLTLDGVALHIGLMPLLQNRIEVSSLTFDSPAITIFLEDDGFRIGGLPRSLTGGKDVETPKTEDDPADPLPIVMNFDSVRIRNGEIVLKDLAEDTQYVFTGLEVSASILIEEGELTLPSFRGETTAFSDVRVSFDGTDLKYTREDSVMAVGGLKLGALGNQVAISGALRTDDPTLKLRITSQGVDLASLGPLYREFAPQMNEYALQGVAVPELTYAFAPNGYILQGKIQLEEVAAQVAGHKLSGISAFVGITADESVQKGGVSSVKGALDDAPIVGQLNFRYQGNRLTIDRLIAKVFSGTAELGATMVMDGAYAYSANASFTGMSVKELLPVILPDYDMPVEGTLRYFAANLTGEAEEDAIATSHGSAEIHLQDGLLRDVNLAAKVLGAVDGIPFLSGTLLQAVPERLREQLNRNYTLLNGVDATFVVRDETLTTTDLEIDGELFDLAAKGTITFAAELDLDSVVSFNPEFSAALAETVSQIQTLFDADGRLTFPVRITGTTSNLRVFPDIKRLLKDTVKTKIEDLVRDALDDLLGGDADDEGGLETEPKKGIAGLLQRIIE